MQTASEYLKNHILENKLTYITAERVVEMALYPDSPLHSYFLWDDRKAAHQHRLWQARQLIASLKITVENMPDVSIRMMVSVPTDRGENGYQLLTEAMKNPDARKSLLDEMASRVEHWKSQVDLLSDDILDWLSSFPHVVKRDRPKLTPRKAAARAKESRQVCV